MLDEVVSLFHGFAHTAGISCTFVNGLADHDTLSFRLFSDTIVVFTVDGSSKSLGDLIKFCQLLIGLSFSDGILLRGAMVRGPVFVDQEAIIGEPVVLAHEMEKQQEWVGCWVQNDCLDVFSDEQRTNVVGKHVLHYEVPLKSRDVTSHLVLNWAWPLLSSFSDDVPTSTAAWRAMFLKHAADCALPSDVEQKLTNTLQFLRHAMTALRVS